MFWLYYCYYAITSILFLLCIHFISGILQNTLYDANHIEKKELRELKPVMQETYVKM
jgi:hypothetical protein